MVKILCFKYGILQGRIGKRHKKIQTYTSVELSISWLQFFLRFRTLIRPYYRGAAGIVLAYDVTDEKTFQNIEEWMMAIAENTQEFQIIQKIILANKTDLNPELHRVSEQEGRQLAAKHGIDFYAVSAKEGVGISEAFMHLTKLVLKAQESMKARRRSVWSATSEEDDIVDLHDIPVHAKKDKSCCNKTKKL